MRVPNVGERVPYVIVYGEPGKPLIQSVRSPEEVLGQKCQWSSNATALRPNAIYYITKVIVPALSRCLSLVGADVAKWYAEMPKLKPVSRLVAYDQASGSSGKSAIPHYFAARQCPICLNKSQSVDHQQDPICLDCKRQEPNLVVKRLSEWIGVWDHRLHTLDQACRQCDVAYDACRSLDCPRLYLRTEAKYDAEQVQVAHQMLQDLF